MTLCLLALSFSANAAKVYNLNELVKKAVTDNPSIEAAGAEYRSNRQLVREAKNKIFPSVSLTGAYIKQKVPTSLTGGFDVSPDQIYSGALEVEQPLFLGGKIWAGMNLREAQLEFAKLDYFAKKQEALAQILEVAFNLALAESRLDLLQDSEKVQQDFVKITRGRSNRGNARRFELDQATATLFSYRTRIRQTATQLNALRAQLSNLIAEDSDQVSFKLPQQLPPSEDVLARDVKYWQQYAIEHRPELLQTNVQIELAEIQKRINFGDHLPQLSFRGSWGYRSLDRDSFAEDSSRASEMTLALSIPIFSGLTSVYQRRADSEKIASATLSKEWLARQLQAEIENYYAQLKQAQALLSESSQWSKAAKAAYVEAQKNYRLGLIDNFQLVQLQTGQEAALISEAEAVAAHHLAWINWNKAIGKDIEEVYLGQKSGI